jgi:hypothetical protein
VQFILNSTTNLNSNFAYQKISSNNRLVINIYIYIHTAYLFSTYPQPPWRLRRTGLHGTGEVWFGWVRPVLVLREPMCLACNKRQNSRIGSSFQKMSACRSYKRPEIAPCTLSTIHASTQKSWGKFPFGHQKTCTSLLAT